MALQVWLPLNGNLNNQGLTNWQFTNNNATVDNSGKIGKCYAFSGSSQYLRLNQKVIDTSQFTISFWMYATDVSANHCIFSTRNVTSGAVNIYLLSAGIRFDTSTTANWQTGFKPSANTWYHITLVQDATTKYLYVNGVLNTSTAGTTDLTQVSSVCTIGCEHINGSSIGTYFAGKLNDFRLYSRALAPKEIEILSRGLVCHYPLEGANNTLLPFGYQQLDYIEGAGAAAFNTTYKFNPETDSVKITFKGNDTSNNGMLFGQSAGKYFWLYYYGSNGIRVYADNGSGQQSIAGISSDLNKHTAEYKNKHYYIDGTDKGSLSNTYAEQTTTSWICSYGSTSYGFKGRIYFAQICRSGVPQRTFIPAKRLSDSKIGMYDVSNNVFYPSSTSTAFTAGNVIGTPSTVYDTSGFKNNGETYAYDTTGSIECSSDTARYSLSTFINSANVTNNATGIRYIYGNCELTTPQYLTVAFWCKPIAGYGSYANNGLFALTNNDIGTGAATDYNTAPMHNRDADVDMCTSTNVHKTLSFSGILNEWHHYAVVYDGRYGKAYIDGVQTATLDMNSNLSLASFKAIVLGYSHAGGVYRKLRAYYSDFRIYATALSATQVAELYNTAVSVANNGTLMGYELVEG